MYWYEIDVEASIVELRSSGAEAGQTLEETVEAALRDPRYRPGFGFLRDRRGMPLATVQYIRDATTRLRAKPELQGTRWAVIVDDHVNFGMMRMASMIHDSLTMELFEDVESARAWLMQKPKAPDGA